MNRQTVAAVAGFFAGVFVTGVFASLSIYELDQKIKTIKKSANHVIDFGHVLLSVIEDHQPELMLDERVKTFLDNQKFEEITHIMLPELGNLT